MAPSPHRAIKAQRLCPMNSTLLSLIVTIRACDIKFRPKYSFFRRDCIVPCSIRHERQPPLTGLVNNLQRPAQHEEAHSGPAHKGRHACRVLCLLVCVTVVTALSKSSQFRWRPHKNMGVTAFTPLRGASISHTPSLYKNNCSPRKRTSLVTGKK